MNQRRVSLAVLVAIAVALGAAIPSAHGEPLPPLAGNGFVVDHVRVFDGTRTIAATTVVIRDGRIVSIGVQPAEAAGLPIVDGRGRTLLPGLIDAHTHTYGDARRDALRFGVTTELDMFTDWHGFAASHAQRATLAKTDVADLWSAGTLATVPGGHGTEYGLPIATLTKPSEAAAFVDARIAEGSDYLKIILEDGSAYGHAIPTLDTATLDALVVAAHAHKLLAVAHVATEDDARRAVDAGVDALVHVFIDRPAEPAVVAAMAQRGLFVVPTLSVAATAAGAGEGAKLAADARIAPWLSASQTQSLNGAFPAGWRKADFLVNATESVRRLHRAGIPLLAGTDAGNPGTTHGATLHQELALLVAAGLTPVEALHAATEEPARRFALPDRGRIATGLRADLVLVDGDPTADIGATRAIVAIWKNGWLVDRTAPPVVAARAETPKSTKPPGAPIADFEDGTVATRYGQNWIVTSDRMIGGRSTATQTWEAGGADGSKGALRIQGTIATGSAFAAWAGSLFMPGSAPFDAVDFTATRALVFRVRGDGRQYTAMLFSGAPDNRAPSIVAFPTTAEWTEVRIPLAQFDGADLARVRGLAFTAGLPAGDFSFAIDDIAIR